MGLADAAFFCNHIQFQLFIVVGVDVGDGPGDDLVFAEPLAAGSENIVWNRVGQQGGEKGDKQSGREHSISQRQGFKKAFRVFSNLVISGNQTLKPDSFFLMGNDACFHETAVKEIGEVQTDTVVNRFFARFHFVGVVFAGIGNHHIPFGGVDDIAAYGYGHRARQDVFNFNFFVPGKLKPGG